MISFFKRLFSGKSSFKFAEPEGTLCTVCIHSENGASPILYTQKNSDGEWLFHCGENAHVDGQFKVATLRQMVDLDPELNGLYRMPEGACASRADEKAKWIPKRL